MKSVVILTTEDRVSKKIYDCLEDKFRDWSNVYYPSTQQTDYIEEIKDFLKNPHGVLVTAYDNFLGVQARNVVLFIGDETDQHMARSMVLRSMAFAIVIHNLQDRNFDIPGIVQDEDLDVWKDGDLATRDFLDKRLATINKKDEDIMRKKNINI